MNQKIFNVLISVVLVVMCGFVYSNKEAIKKAVPAVGGAIHNILESFDEGIAVDGTTIIEGDGDVTADNGLIIGSSGTEILGHYSGSVAVDFGAIPAGECSELKSVALTGVEDGDGVSVTPNNDLAGTTTGSSLNDWSFWGYASTADNYIVAVACNASTTATANPSAGTVRVDVWEH
jgi:hypothetical protein